MESNLNELSSIQRWNVIWLVLGLFCLSFFENLLAASGDSVINLKSIKHDQRPTDLEYALMSKYAYGKDLQKGDTFADLPHWRIFEIRLGSNDYQGVVFENTTTQHMVISHRGTNPRSVRNLIEDIQSVIRGKVSPQELEAYKLVRDITKYAKEKKYEVSFTGHSLGAFLAEISVFFCCKDFDYPNVGAVIFENPGTREALANLQSQLADHKVSLKNLDIIGYVGEPNAINTFNHHVGSLYLIDPYLNSPGWFWDLTWYTRESHSMDNIVKHFKESSTMRDKGESFSYYVTDWPMADWSMAGKLLNKDSWKLKLGKFLYNFFNSQPVIYFKYTELESNPNGARYRLIVDKDDPEMIFDLTYNAHYPIRDKIEKNMIQKNAYH